jgi:mRNA interferase MazF
MEVVIKRGDIVVCALQGDYGKPRPAIVIQSDIFNSTHSSITVCPLTTHAVDAPVFRLALDPRPENGLKQFSQIMVDKVVSIRRDKIREKIGSLSSIEQKNLNDALENWLSLTKELS